MCRLLPPLLVALALGGCMADPYVWQPAPESLEIVVGNRGMGKSHWARERTRTVRRLLVWDPMGDEPNLGHGTLTTAQIEGAAHLLFAGPVRVAVRPTRWSDKDLVEDFERVCQIAYRLGGLCFKVEETGLVSSAQSVPAAFKRLIVTGRHRGVSLILTAQRFAMVPVLARDNASRLVVFRQAGPDDADDLVRRVGEPGAQVRTLDKHAFLEWTPTDGARIRPPLGHGEAP